MAVKAANHIYAAIVPMRHLNRQLVPQGLLVRQKTASVIKKI